MGAQCGAEDGAGILGEHCTTELPSLPLHKNSVDSGARQLCRRLTTDAHFHPLLTFAPDLLVSLPVYLGAVSRMPPMPCGGWGAFLAQSHVWFLSCMGTGCVAKLWTFHCLGKSQSPAGGLFRPHPAPCLGVVICIIGIVLAAMSQAVTRVRCEGVVLAVHSVNTVKDQVELEVLVMFLTTVQVHAYQLAMAPRNALHPAHSRC